MLRACLTVCLLLASVGCGGAESSTGAAGSVGSTSGSGGDTASGGSSGSGSGGGGPFSPDKIPTAMKANDLAVGIDQGKCIVVGPLSSEDGSWTRVAMRPFTGKYDALHWAVVTSQNYVAPDPWTMSIGVVTSSLDPADYDCEQNPTPREVLVVDEVFGEDPEGNQTSVKVLRTSFATGSQESGDVMLACIRNTADPGAGSTALVMCGDAGSGDPERDFWQDSADDGGAVHSMCSYGQSLCRTWMVVPQVEAQ